MHPFETSALSVVGRALDGNAPLSEALWAELHTFLALAKLRSASRAAEQVRISRGTITQHVQRLHDRLGVTLVRFTNAGAVLTPQGEQLALRLQRIDEEISQLSGSLRRGRRIEGDVRVSITEGLGFTFLTPALEEFSARYPGIRLHIHNPVSYRSLVENQTDVMIGFAADEASRVTARRLGSLHYRPFASHRYLERRGMPSATNLDRHDFIDTERYSARGGIWNAWHELTRQGRIAHLCDTSINYGLMVKSGLGIGLLPTFNLTDPQFVRLELDCAIQLPLYGLALRQALQSKPVAVVFDFLCSILDRSNPWLSEPARLDVPFEQTPLGYRLLFNL